MGGNKRKRRSIDRGKRAGIRENKRKEKYSKDMRSQHEDSSSGQPVSSASRH